jgi:hypothetical protein
MEVNPPRRWRIDHMKIKNIKYIGVFLLLFFTISLIPATPCFAAETQVELISDKNEITVGDTITAYIKIKSKSTFGNFEANLIYDKDILEYQSGSEVITGGNGLLKISDMNAMQSGTSRKYKLEFKAMKEGSCNITFSDDVLVYDESENALPASVKDLTIKVNAQKTASSNAFLKSLKISPSGLTPAFHKNELNYAINVSSDTEQLIIDAVPEDSKATVSISGNESLKEGENKIDITVLAESGNIIEYTINVNRDKAPEDAAVTGEVTVTPQPSDNSFEIVQVNGENYAVFRGRYKLIDAESSMIPEGYVPKEIMVSGVNITVYVPENNTDSDIVLIYAENASKEAAFYQYDTNTGTLLGYAAGEKTDDNSALVSKYRSNLNKAVFAIVLLSLISVFLIGFIIWQYKKLKRHK